MSTKKFWTNTRRLPVGQNVIVNDIGKLCKKSAAVGHTCIIERVVETIFVSDSEYKYVLGWSEKDNPGLVFPDCLNTNYFLDEEVTPLFLPHPLIFKSDELPNV